MSSPAATNAQALLAYLQKSLPAVPEDATAPRVLIPSPLTLTREQEEVHVQTCLADFRRLSEELGRTNYNARDWIPSLAAHIRSSGQSAVPFFARTALHHLMRQGNVEWRAKLIGGLFEQQNHHLPLTSRFVDQQVARAQSAFFERKPWFTATPIGAQDDKVAEQVTAWTRHEADECGLEASHRETIDLTFTQGYQVVKVHKDTRVDFYQCLKEVAVDAQGQPLVALDGDYIYKTDQFIPEPRAADPHMTAEQQQALPPTGMVLKRDGKTPQPAPGPDGTIEYAWCTLKRVNTQFDGVRASNVFYSDFLIGLTERDVQSAGVVIEVTSVSLISFIHSLLTNQAWQQAMPSPEERWQIIRKLLERHNGAQAGGNQATGAANSRQPRPELGEAAPVINTTPLEPELNLLLVWKYSDPNNDGFTESTVTMMTRCRRWRTCCSTASCGRNRRAATSFSGIRRRRWRARRTRTWC